MAKKKSKVKKKNKKRHDARVANGTQNKKRLKSCNDVQDITHPK